MSGGSELRPTLVEWRKSNELPGEGFYLRDRPGRQRRNERCNQLLAALSRLLSRERWQASLVAPATLLRWHREAGRRQVASMATPTRPGRPGLSAELIVRLGREDRTRRPRRRPPRMVGARTGSCLRTNSVIFAPTFCRGA